MPSRLVPTVAFTLRELLSILSSVRIGGAVDRHVINREALARSVVALAIFLALAANAAELPPQIQVDRLLV